MVGGGETVLESCTRAVQENLVNSVAICGSSVTVDYAATHMTATINLDVLDEHVRLSWKFQIKAECNENYPTFLRFCGKNCLMIHSASYTYTTSYHLPVTQLVFSPSHTSL